MGRGASLSLLGMYNWNNTLFDGMSFPAAFDAATKELFKNNLVMECAELEILYSDWDFLKFAIDNWSAKEVLSWERYYAAMTAEYNPIENYNRTEDSSVTHSGAVTHSGKDSNQASGTDSNQASGTDSNAHTGTVAVAGSGTDTDTLSRTSFENTTFAKVQKNEMLKGSTQTTTYNDTQAITNGRRDDFTHGKKEELTYGHIITDTTGVTTRSNISGNEQVIQG